MDFFVNILTFLIFYSKLSYLLIVFDMDSWVSLFSNSKFIYLLILLGMDFLTIFYFLFFSSELSYLLIIFDMDFWVNLDR